MDNNRHDSQVSANHEVSFVLDISPSKYFLAHDLDDPSNIRSKDVIANEDVTFDDLLLDQRTRDGLERCHFRRPSPIQLASIPLGLCGFNLVIQSKAGTGKTCIFTLVALEALKFNSSNNTQTLIIAPTREVAMQIHEVVALIGSLHTDLGCILCIGGVDVRHDRTEFSGKKRCQIVIGTPGRVKQLIELNILQTQHIELFVLDEADKLMDEQFKSQIDDIYKRLPLDKQMIVTSATYPNELSGFLSLYMVEPKIIRLGQELCLEAIDEHYVRLRPGHSTKKTLDNKLELARKILDQISFTKCIIFTNFQARASIICDNLNKEEKLKVKFGIISYLCAELSQQERVKIFKMFKNSNEKGILVSTDISARGIDIYNIDLIINFDIPADTSTYYHRIGRAGRFGQRGKAITLLTSETVELATFMKNVHSFKITELKIL